MFVLNKDPSGGLSRLFHQGLLKLKAGSTQTAFCLPVETKQPIILERFRYTGDYAIMLVETDSSLLRTLVGCVSGIGTEWHCLNLRN